MIESKSLIDVKRLMVFVLFSITLFSAAEAGLEPYGGYPIHISVNPEEGALYNNTTFFNDFKDYNYTYTLEFLDSNKNNLPKKMWLQFYNDVSRNWNYSDVEIDNVRQDRIMTQEVNLSKILGEYLGDVKYRLISNNENPSNSILYESTGPRITINFESETWNKKDDDSYNYRVLVRSLNSPIDIYLYYQDPSSNLWTYYSEIQPYRSNSSEWLPISWEDAPYFSKLEFGIKS